MLLEYNRTVNSFASFFHRVMPNKEPTCNIMVYSAVIRKLYTLLNRTVIMEKARKTMTKTEIGGPEGPVRNPRACYSESSIPSTPTPNKNLGQEARITRGAEIASKPNQITRIDDLTYTVRSQSSNRIYELMSTEHGWICSCPDHMYRGVACKHIHAVEISRRMREAVQEEIPKTVIKQVDLTKCKRCKSPNVVKDSIRRLKKGDTQQYKCKNCGFRFTHNLGFEGKRATPEQICTAVELVFSGPSSRKTATTIKSMGVRTCHRTVQNWAKEYSDIMEAFADKITPQVGEAWRTDELHLKIKGNKRYLFAMLDSETRFWIAKMVAEHKGVDGVQPMFRQAKRIAGKVPTTLKSDKAANFHRAWKDHYRAKNFLHKDTWHINEVAFDGIHHNNQMESFNGATLRHREKVTRGLKKEDSSIISGLQLYHNFFRPHLGLPDQITPAEAAGITIEGTNKILTMIRAAAEQAAA